ncbi:MAG: c-type cytochrome [Gemmatimonadales bacterium]
MRHTTLLFFSLAATTPAAAQATGHFPPDSLVNTQVIPHNTPVRELLGRMRGFTMGLGVRCTFCHVGEEGNSLATFDFPSDKKQTKLIARQMMRMVDEINRRVDTIPGHANDDPRVECNTCHRGVHLPEPLSQLIQEAALAGGADSAVRAYRALHQQYYGRASYDFGEGSLDQAAFGVARAGKPTDALKLLALNDESFPASATTAVTRGNIQLQQGDTAAAIAAYRDALRRDSTDNEARGRLARLGQRN